MAKTKPIAATAERSSNDLRVDLIDLDAAREASVAHLTELEASRDAVLMSDDDAEAEAHDAEIQRIRRAIERAELKRPGLVAAIEAAVSRETAEAKSRQQVEAREAVTALIARVHKGYEEPAAIISAFLSDWKRVSELARAAGVEGPDQPLRERDPQMIEPEGEDVYLAYIDEHGRETDQPYPAGVVGFRPDGSRDAAPRRSVRRTRPRPAQYDRGIYLGSLAGRTNLPPARAGEAAAWEGHDLMLKDDAKPRLQRFV